MEKRHETDLYARGDYSFLSRVFEPSSEALTEAAQVSAGNRVLDVATGNGNTALAAARRGAMVTALDISRAQIEKGRARARMGSRSIAWVEADAGRLPFADGSFDCCLNSFGDAIAVEEMFRIVRAGGVIGITDWTGEGFAGALSKLQDSLTIDPVRAQPHTRWGREGDVRTALIPRAQAIDIRRYTTPARFESVDGFCSELPRKDTDLNHDELSFDQRKRFSEELYRLVTEWNRADDDSLLLELHYLLTIATKAAIEA